MKKRIGAIILTAALALMLLPATAQAADTVLTVKTPATIPKEGETFTVSVDVTGNPGFNSLELTLAYDRTAVFCESVRLGSVTKGALSASNPDANGGAKLSVASAESLTGDGPIMICKFRSLTGADPGIALTKQLLSDENGKGLPCTVKTEAVAVSKPVESSPTTTEAEVTVPEPLTQSENQNGWTTPRDPDSPPALSGGETAETSVGTTAAPFSDTARHWGAEWIAKAAERGLFEGYPDGGFHPDAQISRGDYVLVLYRMAGEPEVTEMSPFADVHSNDYYAKAIAWAYSKGYVEGTGAGFAPQNSLTRQEAMKILYGYAGSPTGMEVMFTGIYDEAFADSSEIAAWAKPAMYWAVYNTILNGMDGGLNPTGTATRAQLAKILVEYQNKIK